MSRKDYIAIAGAIKLAQSAPLDSRLAVVADNLMDVLAADNPNFDRERFLEAALGTENQ